ncbi:CsgG/HfaB family protein [Pseudoalteromonas denitrificans]|uniref:Curli production assembly/transport component CsgG n=1 Tax=Pseudoalteromonas denitrificans DSM 6059 TaxID=1123010 RepID=A0A1I1FNB5_9GAMM|nr:CsgG/HfaB family protein [Pseudoalteromonas denitrificans]SFB98520.1 Curli production assembly/transport component CsgG [Pseudoalteromonas denitrificans DSM 6059]
MLNKKWVFLVFIIITLVGCQSTSNKGKKEFDISQQLMSSNKYAEAVSYLELAIQKEPKNPQYKAILAQARSKAVTQLTNEIKNVFSSGDLNKTSIETAKNLFNKAKKIQSQHESYQTTQSNISNNEAILLNKVKQLHSNVKSHITNNKWVNANFSMKKLAKLYANYEDSSLLTQKIKIQGGRYYFNLARDAFNQDNFTATLENARKAITINPNNKNAKQLIENTNKKNNKEYFIQVAEKAKAQLNWEGAFEACEKVISYDRINPYCVELMQISKTQWTESLVSQSRQLMTQGYLAKSADKIIQGQKINNGYENAQLTALKNSLSEQIDNTASELMDQRKYGSAWYLMRLISDFNPDFVDLFKKTKHIEDAIVERVKKSIAVFDFKSPSYSTDSGVLVANNLISNLFNSASKDINILERENLKSILEEMKLGQIGVVSESTAQEMGRIYGIDIAIMGSVLLYKVDATDSKSSKTVRYKVGEEISDNIDYLNWKAMNPNPKKEDLRSAPKAKIMTPKFEEKEYDVQHMKKVGFIQLSFRIVDVATGANTRVETIERKKIVEDTSNEGIKDANVDFDPLEIPTDTELLQTMATEVVEELSREVLKPLRNLEKTYFENGEEFLLRRKENINAIEQFVDAIFDEKLKAVVGSPITTQSNKYLQSIIENHRF